MPDSYRVFADSALGGQLVRRLGLPRPTRLRRQPPDAPPLPGAVLLGGHAGDLEPVLSRRLGAEVHTAARTAGYASLVFDARALTTVGELSGVHAFFHEHLKRLNVCGRVLVLAAIVDEHTDPETAATHTALEGFTRSLGKELRAGGTAQLLRLPPGPAANLESTLRFLLSYRSAFVSGQVVTLTADEPVDVADPDRPLSGKVALVTGAARGIGAVTAARLAAQGANVVCLDVAAAGEELAGVATELGGSAVQLDLATPDAPSTLADWLAERHGGVDVVVHNAGITRDKTLARMDADRWDAVLRVNLAAPHRITTALLERDLLRRDGRVIAMSSVTGIAGNRGQTNYAASKAGLIGLVRALAPRLRDRGVTANAVAPGFIETRMTAAVPVLEREVGRRLSSLAQGGLPIDVAETIAWLAHPGSSGVTGNVVRVCGQNFLGA